MMRQPTEEDNTDDFDAHRTSPWSRGLAKGGGPGMDGQIHGKASGFRWGSGGEQGAGVGKAGG